MSENCFKILEESKNVRKLFQDSSGLKCQKDYMKAWYKNFRKSVNSHYSIFI